MNSKLSSTFRPWNPFCCWQGSELHKVEDDEEPAPSTEHVETRRQKTMREGKE